MMMSQRVRAAAAPAPAAACNAACAGWRADGMATFRTLPVAMRPRPCAPTLPHLQCWTWGKARSCSTCRQLPASPSCTCTCRVRTAAGGGAAAPLCASPPVRWLHTDACHTPPASFASACRGGVHPTPRCPFLWSATPPAGAAPPSQVLTSPSRSTLVVGPSLWPTVDGEAGHQLLFVNSSVQVRGGGDEGEARL